MSHPQNDPQRIHDDQQQHNRNPPLESAPKRVASSSLPRSASSPPNKRPCSVNSLVQVRAQHTIQSILHLPEDTIWGLRKHDLRAYFLVLQQYARNPYPLVSSSACSPQNNLQILPINASIPALLRLPLEIRQQIYKHTLPPPVSQPVKGPHPRQLQNSILLTQPITPSLLLLNHQIRSEALPLLFGCPSQKVHITIDYNVWAHKTRRSDLIVSSSLTSCIRHISLHLHLGSEKRVSKPGETEAEARITEVRKGIKKLGKWLSGADIQTMRVSWQEPPQTYSWEAKREILDALRVLRAVTVEAGEINWGLNWNKGRKYRFEIDYLKELERGRQVEVT